MDNKQFYTIGQATEICDVTARTIRYYESKCLITPDRVSEGGYRYYTMETLRRVQVIRYFVEEGFSLEVARQLLDTNDLDDYERIFRQQMEETKAKLYYYQNRFDSLKGWYGLICEGKSVNMIGPDNFSLKHIPTQKYLCMEGVLDVDDPYSEAKLETRHFTLAKSDGHSLIDVGGSYILHSCDYHDRIAGVSAEVTLIQTAYPNSLSHENIQEIPGFMAVSAYHMGNLNKIASTYRRAVQWAKTRGMELAGDAYERYVIDIYTSDNPDDYVTEILLPLVCDSSSHNYFADSEY